MRNDTRVLYTAYLAQVAALSGVASAHATFAVDPTVQQKLESRIQESSDFLAAINMTPVDELMGQKVGLGVSGTIASRTDTSGTASRSPRDVASTDKQDYKCEKTDFDTAIPTPCWMPGRSSRISRPSCVTLSSSARPWIG